MPACGKVADEAEDVDRTTVTELEAMLGPQFPQGPVVQDRAQWRRV
jgi:hypothetical protein